MFAGINDVVGFHGDSVAELRIAFEEAVEDYLTTCEKLNRAPQKPYSGKLMLRVSPEVHAAVGGGRGSERQEHQSVGGRDIHQGCARLAAGGGWHTVRRRGQRVSFCGVGAWAGPNTPSTF